ncbi:MAG: hypothetical protein COV29_01780 [Candidatus Yanofskybacteria bacterium CG10_big_fil_rev_8_21_14_0_10_36_16]|uniref:Uncharacterized protein n=1 Tax=Candidatus Yanofskybacteria bacterium CG10_big_fil_rev_8_21_14_0_10_36_16 TaxID=1975096 RepID=A0A2J0Q7D9_9BACT|nr:MAG: hypothetical protein COV29_01780 [Candidatus Yanofskybacteria bacterium CG10_big_fil_rev_8_21_14_0_10_36_16]
MDENNKTIEETEKPIEEASEWLDEFGEPSQDYISELVESGSTESINTLREIADKYDVDYTDSTTPQELADLIFAAIRNSDQ